MRLIDADALLEGRQDHEQISTHLIWNAPTVKLEKLNDKEQRIFIAAMSREEDVCKQVDSEFRDWREPYEDSLVWICHEITRKVKATLWKGVKEDGK